jgi:branched-chain amino acid transport system permease protein
VLPLELNLVAALDFSTLPQQLVNGLLLGSIYALIALGYTMVYGILRLINFAHGEVFMLGAYTALFVSYAAAARTAGDALYNPLIAPGGLATAGLLVAVLGIVVLVYGAYLFYGKKHKSPALYIGGAGLSFGVLSYLLASYQPNAINLVLMMLASMAVCAVIGVVIEFFAYRPMRAQSRISILITAIGVSLLLQYGGQLFLPSSPPPSINENVNPYREVVPVTLSPAPEDLQAELEEAAQEVEVATANFEEVSAGQDRFDLDETGKEARDEMFAAEARQRELRADVQEESLSFVVPKGQLIMFITALVLMFLLRHLVLFTKMGRAMRAVSHDHEAASLMGINVNRVVSFTFIVGSALAGAGAMMSATFLGTALTPFYGLFPGVKAFIAAVLGGIGNIPGAALGGLIMGVAETLVVWSGYSNLRDAIAFVILIAVLLFRPGGILGSSKVEKV